jgi:hypothetical protein
MFKEHWWNDIDKRKLKYWEKNVTASYVVANNFTWTGL